MKRKASLALAALTAAAALSLSGCGNLEAFVIYNAMLEKEESVFSRDYETLSSIELTSEDWEYTRFTESTETEVYLDSGTQSAVYGRYLDSDNNYFDYEMFYKDGYVYQNSQGLKMRFPSLGDAFTQASEAIEKDLGAGALTYCVVKDLDNGGKTITLQVDTDAVRDYLGDYEQTLMNTLNIGGAADLTITEFMYQLTVDSEFYNDGCTYFVFADITLEDGTPVRMLMAEEIRVTGRNNTQRINYPGDLSSYTDVF